MAELFRLVKYCNLPRLLCRCRIHWIIVPGTKKWCSRLHFLDAPPARWPRTRCFSQPGFFHPSEPQDIWKTHHVATNLPPFRPRFIFVLLALSFLWLFAAVDAFVQKSPVWLLKSSELVSVTAAIERISWGPKQIDESILPQSESHIFLMIFNVFQGIPIFSYWMSYHIWLPWNLCSPVRKLT